jgi:hypothetical protein
VDQKMGSPAFGRSQVQRFERMLRHAQRRQQHRRTDAHRLQDISTTGVDSRRREGTPGDSIDGAKRLEIDVLRRKSCAISQLVDRPGSGSIPAASTTNP